MRGNNTRRASIGALGYVLSPFYPLLTLSRAFGWLYEHHPRTAIANLHMLVDPVCPVVGQETHRASHGYWKDLLNILALAVVGELGLNSSNFLHRPRRSRKRNRGWTSHTGKRKNNQDRFLSRKERRPLIAERRHDALVRKLEDPKFRALYVGVARLFAGRLVKDWQLSAGLASKDLGSTQVRKELRKILSPVGKWAPTPGGSHDRFTNITTAISSVIYHSRDSIPDIPFPKALESIDEAASVHQSLQGSTIMRSYLRRWILAPLRQLTSVTESLMGTKQWNKINYSLVPSYCMKNNVKVFSKHGGGGLKEYLAGVSQGKRSISSSILSPTDIVNQTRRTNLKKLSSDSRDRELTKPEQREERAAALNFRQLIMDAQWRSLVDRYRQLGILHNSLAITGGGSGVDPAVALAFFINQLAPPPFRGGMIVGGIYPRYFTYQPDAPLSQVLGEIEELYGYRFNLYSVFVDLLLPIAKLHHVRKEDMIKRLYVLHNGDMTAFEKDYRPIAGKWETHQDKMEAAFRDAGYDVPEVVYWDVSAHDSGNTGTPVLHDKDGVALFSNPSPTPLKVLTQMEPSDPAGFTPYSVMMKVLGRPSYDGLRVLD